MSVSEHVHHIVAETFGMPVEDVRDDLNLLEDLKANSVKFFPIMNDLEEEYDLDIQYQEFRSGCPTVGDIIAFVESEI